MDVIDPGASDPALAADAGAAADVGQDPAAAVDMAVEQGVAAPTREREPTPDEIQALVKRWWDRTAETADFEDAVKQTSDDIETLEGGTREEKADAAEVTVNHVYRNAIQTVALTVPEMASISWKPRDEVKPLPGMPIPQVITARRRQQQGLASVITVLFNRFAEMGNLQEKIEAWVQDGVHFRASVAKVWWQNALISDPISESRLPDEQDLHAKARVLVEQYDQGLFSRGDAQYAEMRQALQAIGRTESDIKRGIVVELRPLANYRCDPSVTGPEYIDTAAWESDDVLYKRDEILAKWPHISAEDLQSATVWSLDATGRAIKQERRDQTTTTRDLSATRALNDLRRDADDWFLCREIYDYETNTRLVLVDGLNFPAVEEPLERGPSGMSPFVLLITNRRSGRLRGWSDTELQAKIQRQLNRLRSQEEESRRNAQPRFAANASAFAEPGDLQKAMEAPPNTVTPVRCTSGKALTEEVVPLHGNHEHNPQEFDGGKLTQEMRKMAMLPEQAAGELGQAEFATEVQVAAAGANSLARYRQTRITRALKKIADKAAQLILLNCPQDLAVSLAGPLAAMFYPAEPMDRREVYDGLTISVEVALDKQLDYARRADSLAKLVDSFAKGGVTFDKEVAGRLLGRFLNLGDETDDLIKPDPNDLIGRLMQAMQEQPGALAPEAIMALMQLGQMAQAQAAQLVAQQGGGMPPAPGGGGMPGAPMGRMGPPQPAAPQPGAGGGLPVGQPSGRGGPLVGAPA
jgi:hypothetical protein